MTGLRDAQAAKTAHLGVVELHWRGIKEGGGLLEYLRYTRWKVHGKGRQDLLWGP